MGLDYHAKQEKYVHGTTERISTVDMIQVYYQDDSIHVDIPVIVLIMKIKLWDT